MTSKTQTTPHMADLGGMFKDAEYAQTTNPYAHTHTARAEIGDTLDQLTALKAIAILPRKIVEQINNLQSDLIIEWERKHDAA